MKTCLFCQLATRSAFARSIYTRFSALCCNNRNILMVFVILENMDAFVATLRQKRSHFPLNLVHLLHKMAGKVTLDVPSKLISVNCITQCVK